MKKIVIEKPGGYASLIIRTVDPPSPEASQYLIDIKYIGVNYADIIIREGYYTAAKGKYPMTPGFEFSGVIKEVGEGANEYKVGEEVCGITLFNGYSTSVIAEEFAIRRLPDGWDLKESAALLVPNLTAYHALHNVAHAKKDEVILVHSAAGGVGTALLQQAEDIGCKSVAVVGSSEKISVTEQFGASHTVVSSENLWNEIDRIVPEGFDVVFDANGLHTPRPGYERLRLGGRLIIYGFAQLFPRGRRPWFPTLALKALRLPRFGIRNMTSENRTISGLNIAFLFDRRDLALPALNYIIESASSNKIHKPPIKTFNFNEVVSAHKYMESGKSVGRILLSVE